MALKNVKSIKKEKERKSGIRRKKTNPPRAQPVTQSPGQPAGGGADDGTR